MASSVKLSELCSEISYGYTASAESEVVGPKFLRITDIQGGVVNWDEVPYCKIDEKNLAKNLLKKGDIVVARTGNSTGENYIFDADDDAVFASYLIRFRVNPELANPYFVWLQMRTHAWWNFVSGAKGGSAQAGANAKVLGLFEVELPERNIQDKIVDIVFGYFNKIELNRQTNQTLEQMAQALFKSWFVDFDPVIDNALAAGNDIPEALQHKAELRLQAQQLPDFTQLPDDIRALFPSGFKQTDEPNIGISGWIPKGWEKTSFESLIKLIGGGTPKTSVEEYWNGDIPWFSVVDAPNDSDVFVLDTEKHVTQLGVDNSSTKILRKGTTIISARGTVGKCALVGEPMAMNQSCYGINGNEGIADTFIYFLTRYQVSDLQKRGHGSVFNTITRETFKSINVVFSGGDLTKAFERLVRPYLDKILLNNRQVTELVKMREVLLPKLISGELIINKDVA